MNEELIKKAKGAKSAEELKSLALGAGLTLTDEQATEYYAKINRSGELADEELDNVAGGGCGNSDGPVIEQLYGQVDRNNIECPNCHARPVQVIGETRSIYDSTQVILECRCAQCGKEILVYID